MGDEIALAAVIVAAVTTVVTAVISIASTAVSQRAALASEKSAKAAVDAVGIAAEQVALARQAQHAAAAPEFVARIGPIEDGQCAVHLRMIRAAEPVSGEVSIAGSAAFADGSGDVLEATEPLPSNFFPNSYFWIFVPYTHSFVTGSPVWVRLDVTITTARAGYDQEDRESWRWSSCLVSGSNPAEEP